MIIADNFRENFYYPIVKAANVVIFSYTDVDSLCATHTLTTLLLSDEVTFSVVSLSSSEELSDQFSKHSTSVKTFVLVNCGAMKSLLDIVPSEGTTLYVVDPKRPIDLANVFDKNIKVMVSTDELEHMQLPQSSEVFRDDEDSEDDEEDEEGDNRENRNVLSIAERVERRMLKRKEREEWQARRDKIVWEYSHLSYTSIPSSVFILQLAGSMAKCTADFLWCGAVGLAAAHVQMQISLETYSRIVLECMKPYIRKFGPRGINRVDTTLRVSFEKELQLPLYRHWTLADSIHHDAFFICKCRLWTQAGKEMIKHIYAKIPLSECLNSYERISSQRRKELFDILQDYMQTDYSAFFSHFGYARSISSVDFARMLALKLQFSAPLKAKSELFVEAWNFLREFIHRNGSSKPEVDLAAANYKTALSSLTTLAFDSMQQKRFMNTTSFIILTIPWVPETEYLFASAHCLDVFIYISLRVFAGTKRSDRRLKKPLFVAALGKPADESGVRYYAVGGCMPLADILTDPERKSVIPGVLAEIAADRSIATVYDPLSPTTIRVREDSYPDFFSRLENQLVGV